jgi:hypothetical protein
MGEKTSNGRGTVDPRVEGFISRWQGRQGGQERANLPDIGKKLGEPRRMGAQVSDNVFAV